jgi:hypothetical protein
MFKDSYKRKSNIYHPFDLLLLEMMLTFTILSKNTYVGFSKFLLKKLIVDMQQKLVN